MENGALPHGPSYRAHPRLYHKRLSALPPEGPLTEVAPTKPPRRIGCQRFRHLFWRQPVLVRSALCYSGSGWEHSHSSQAVPPAAK